MVMKNLPPGSRSTLVSKLLWIEIIVLASLLVPADVAISPRASPERIIGLHSASHGAMTASCCCCTAGGGRGMILLRALRGGSSIDRPQGGTGGESTGYGGSSVQFSFRDLLSKRTGTDGGGSPYFDDTDVTETIGWGGAGGAGGSKGTFSPLMNDIDLESMDAGALLERARKMEASGSTGYQKEALRCIENCIRKDGCLPAAWVIKARLALDYKSDPLAAAEYANASLAAKSRNPDALFLLGYTANNTAVAMAWFDASLKICPYHSDALRAKGLLLLRGGAHETKRAIEMLDKAAKESPLDPVPLLSLAYAFSLCGDPIQAMRCIQAARDLGRGRITLSSVAADRAESYIMRRRGQLDEAGLVLDACVLDFIGPDSNAGKVSVASSASLSGEFSQACVEHALIVNRTLGHIEATNRLRDALAVAPGSPSILMCIAAIQITRGVPDAFEIAQECLSEAATADLRGTCMCHDLLWPSTERAWSIEGLQAELLSARASYGRQESLKASEGWAHWPYGMDPDSLPPTVSVREPFMRENFPNPILFIRSKMMQRPRPN